jgi:hypothetical protein
MTTGSTAQAPIGLVSELFPSDESALHKNQKGVDLMQTYPDRGVKAAAIIDFIDLLGKDKQLKTKVLKHQSPIRNYLVYKIQNLGIHDYAKRVLDKKSTCRVELESIINEASIGEN